MVVQHGLSLHMQGHVSIFNVPSNKPAEVRGVSDEWLLIKSKDLCTARQTKFSSLSCHLCLY